MDRSNDNLKARRGLHFISLKADKAARRRQRLQSVGRPNDHAGKAKGRRVFPFADAGKATKGLACGLHSASSPDIRLAKRRAVISCDSALQTPRVALQTLEEGAG